MDGANRFPMRRPLAKVLVLLAALGGFAAPAFGQNAGSTSAKLQQLQQLRQAARDAAKSAAARQPPPPPPPTVTALQRPNPTFNQPPPPPPTVTVFLRTPPPPPTVTAVVVAPSASAPPKPKAVDPRPADPSRLAGDTSLEKLRKTRQDRRHTDAGKLQQRWGDLLSDDRAKAELKVHAEHMAYLQRIRALAQNANDAKSVEGVDILITQEEKRDGDALNALRSGAPGAPQ
jgi:type II secretory pathway pseudopilin PulG